MLMNNLNWFCAAAVAAWGWGTSAQEFSIEQAPAVVIRTSPVAGTIDVDPATTRITVTFSKPMQDGSWSWTTWGEGTFPEMDGKPYYEADGRTCVLPVKLQPGRFYATWLNSQKFGNFRDAQGRSAVPYLLTFQTAGEAQSDSRTQTSTTGGPAESGLASLLNEDQRKVLEWTDRQFRRFFDHRSSGGYSPGEVQKLEEVMMETLKGRRSAEYYRAINTLGALKSQAAVQPLLKIAADRAEKDNRDRWMAVRALGLIGNQSVVPELIHLTYHGNTNTRWWAQISLVRLTGVNFGKDWQGWGRWWNQQGNQPAFDNTFIKWYSAEEWSEPEAAMRSADTYDTAFLQQL
jgi:hypothetical protein